MADIHRISITLSDNLKKQIEELKENMPCDISYSELYRQVIRAGIDETKNNSNQIDKNNNL